jgi:hypothetical protein
MQWQQRRILDQTVTGESIRILAEYVVTLPDTIYLVALAV